MEDCNIGLKEESYMVKLSKGIPQQYKQRYLNLLKAYKYVFVWSYDDLKTFDINVIHVGNTKKRGWGMGRGGGA